MYLPCSHNLVQLLAMHLFCLFLSACCRYDNYSRPSNPFLVPLTKYLDRYPTETMDYFLEKEKLGRASTAGLLVRDRFGCGCLECCDSISDKLNICFAVVRRPGEKIKTWAVLVVR